MNLIQELFSWFKTCPLWVQDAARRLYNNPEGLSETDYQELFHLCLKENGVAGEDGMVFQPVDSVLGAANPNAHHLVLKSLHGLKHVNAIGQAQTLMFKDKGLTIIYGQNGSGKSGYARVFKKACFSRDREERIIPNVTKATDPNCIPEAIFDVELDGQAKSILWKQSDNSMVEELSYISVFDTRSARVVLSKEQECYYVPYGLDILQNIGNMVIPKVKTLITDRLSSIDLSTTQFSQLSGNHEVGRIFQSLASVNYDDIVKLSQLEPEEMERGKELSEILQSTDFRKDMENARLSAVRIKNYLDKVNDLSAKLADEEIENDRQIRLDYNQAIIDEQNAAHILKGDTELLPGTGEDLWKALFEAARKFSLQSAYPEEKFPPISTGKKCVLCQQSLTDDAVERLTRFNTYISSELSNRVKDARSRLESTIAFVKTFDVAVLINSSILEEINNILPDIIPSVREYLANLSDRHRDLLLSLEGRKEWCVCILDKPSPVTCMRNIVARQYHVSRKIRDSMDEGKRLKQQQELEGLRARVRLSRLLPQVKAWFDRKAQRDELQGIVATLSPLPYTRKVVELTGKVMTEPMQNALESEFRALGVNSNAVVLPIYKSRGVQGRVLSSFGLNCPSKELATKVLSEGQLKAIALASFFAETDVAGHSHAMVFDDPISSLDIVRMRLVAFRLAQEAHKRQIIVFSHNVVFVNSLRICAEEIGVPILEQSLSVSVTGTGTVNVGLPWNQKNWNDRISEIRHLSKLLKGRWTACPSDSLIAEMQKIYDKLRATVERIVQDVCLNGTVRRFEDFIRVPSLEKAACLDLQSARKLIKLYHEFCEHVEAHDHSESTPNIPSIENLESDIQNLEDLTKQIVNNMKTELSNNP